MSAEKFGFGSNEKYALGSNGASDVGKTQVPTYDAEVTPAGDQTVHDAVFGDLDEDGPDYRGVSRRGGQSCGLRWQETPMCSPCGLFSLNGQS